MNKHEMVISFNEDCDDPYDSVCIGFDFKCPICNELADIEPKGIASLYYINATYSRSMPIGTLIRCPHCKNKFKTICDQEWMSGKVLVEIVKRKNNG